MKKGIKKAAKSDVHSDNGGCDLMVGFEMRGGKIFPRFKVL
jgi:hypothetical protein